MTIFIENVTSRLNREEKSLFLFNYYFAEFELETGKSHDLDIFHRTSTVLAISQAAVQGHSSEVSLESRRGIVYIERF